MLASTNRSVSFSGSRSNVWPRNRLRASFDYAQDKQQAAPLHRYRYVEKFGSGAWTRTKILGFKGLCAANCTTPEPKTEVRPEKCSKLAARAQLWRGVYFCETKMPGGLVCCFGVKRDSQAGMNLPACGAMRTLFIRGGRVTNVIVAEKKLAG